MALTTNLVAFWELGEASGTRNDSVGANHLTDVNTVTSATGKVGDAASFAEANSERLTIADNAAVSIVGDTFFQAWVKPTGVGGLDAVFAKNGEYECYLNGDTAVFTVYDSSSGNSTAQSGAATISAGTWHHLILTYDTADKKARLYIDNGSEVVGGALTNGAKDSTADFEIGALNSNFYMEGLIDQVGKWDRLPTTQDRTDLNNGNAGLSYAAMGGGGGGTGAGTRRYGDVPSMGTQRIGPAGSRGGVWGRSKTGLYVPRRLAA